MPFANFFFRGYAGLAFTVMAIRKFQVNATLRDKLNLCGTPLLCDLCGLQGKCHEYRQPIREPGY